MWRCVRMGVVWKRLWVGCSCMSQTATPVSRTRPRDVSTGAASAFTHRHVVVGRAALHIQLSLGVVAEVCNHGWCGGVCLCVCASVGCCCL